MTVDQVPWHLWLPLAIAYAIALHLVVRRLVR